MFLEKKYEKIYFPFFFHFSDDFFGLVLGTASSSLLCPYMAIMSFFGNGKKNQPKQQLELSDRVEILRIASAHEYYIS